MRGWCVLRPGALLHLLFTCYAPSMDPLCACCVPYAPSMLWFINSNGSWSNTHVGGSPKATKIQRSVGCWGLAVNFEVARLVHLPMGRFTITDFCAWIGKVHKLLNKGIQTDVRRVNSHLLYPGSLTSFASRIHHSPTTLAIAFWGHTSPSRELYTQRWCDHTRNTYCIHVEHTRGYFRTARPQRT